MSPSERRAGNEVILDRLGDIKTNLALNTQETGRLAEYQKTLNGKVVAHETRLQSIESNQALTSTALAQLQAEKFKQDGTMNEWTKYFIKAALAIAGAIIYFILTRNGFPDFL